MRSSDCPVKARWPRQEPAACPCNAIGDGHQSVRRSLYLPLASRSKESIGQPFQGRLLVWMLSLLRLSLDTKANSSEDAVFPDLWRTCNLEHLQ